MCGTLLILTKASVDGNKNGHFHPGTGSKSAANDLKQDGDNQEKEGIYAE